MFDVTEEAKHIIQGLLKMQNVTLRYLAELYRGQMSQKKNSDMVIYQHENVYLLIGKNLFHSSIH